MTSVQRTTGLRLLLATALAAALLPFLGVGSAFACSCSGPAEPPKNQDKVSARDADYVFSGTLTGTVQPDRPGDMSSTGDPVVHDFAVDRVYKGSVVEHQRILSAMDGSSCGLELRGPGPYLIYARNSERPAEDWLAPEDRNLPRAGLCSGTRTIAVDSPVRLGAGQAPLPDPQPTAPAGDETLANDEGSSSNLGVLALAGGLLIVGGAIVLTRKRRHP